MVKHRKSSQSVQTYVTKTQKTKIEKTWRKKGYFSEADYVRDLIRFDMKTS
jgi:hypothetical protein